MAVWKCPIHGNMFEERPMTGFQKQVMEIALRQHAEGQEPTAEGISWIVNRTRAAVKRALAELIQLVDDPKKKIVFLSAAEREPADDAAMKPRGAPAA